MKPLKMRKAIFLFLAITTLLSCKNDDQGNVKNEEKNLIGVWQRSDVTQMKDYKLYFNTESAGYSTEFLANEDSTAISALREFMWNTNQNILTINYSDGAIETTPFSINANGQLIVTDISQFPFNKL
jgi:uncharacterized membrane protein